MAGNPDDKGSLDELKKSLENLASPAEAILTSIGNMYDAADSLNNAFVAGRTRLDEMADAAARSAAGVFRLGGDITKVQETIAGIAEGAKRNFIAGEEQVSKLYAASTLLNISKSTEKQGYTEIELALVGKEKGDFG